MQKSTTHPSGDKIKKAIQEFSDLLIRKPEKKRQQLLQEVAMKFDLSPKECAFLERHYNED
jgi:hypothetical protein